MKKLKIVLAALIVPAVFAGCSLIGSKNQSKPNQTSRTPDVSTSNSSDNSDNKSTVSSGGQDVAGLEQTAENSPRDFDAQLNLARKYQSVKSDDKAVATYKKAIDIKPESAEANYELGKIYVAKKDYELSLPYLQKAAKINHKSPAYLVAAGDNLRELKRCNDAMPHYGNAVNFDGKNAQAYYGMVLCYLELNNRIAAEQQLRALEQIDRNLAAQIAPRVRNR